MTTEFPKIEIRKIVRKKPTIEEIQRKNLKVIKKIFLDMVFDVIFDYEMFSETSYFLEHHFQYINKITNEFEIFEASLLKLILTNVISQIEEIRGDEFITELCENSEEIKQWKTDYEIIEKFYKRIFKKFLIHYFVKFFFYRKREFIPELLEKINSRGIICPCNNNRYNKKEYLGHSKTKFHLQYFKGGKNLIKKNIV